MTTIIIIVVVALVFFVTICVVTFMVWKREAEMRTDSIKAIEHNVEEMLYELTGETSREIRRRKRKEDERHEGHEQKKEPDDSTQKENNNEAPPEKTQDPFDWVRAGGAAGEENADSAEKARENITVFEPDAMQYTSFETKSGHSQGESRRGLRWKEIQDEGQESRLQEAAQERQAPEMPQDVLGAHDAAEIPEAVELPETPKPPETPEIPETPVSLVLPEADQLQEADESQHASDPGRMSRFFRKHKKTERQEHEDEPEQEPEQTIYESVEDLLREYIDESSMENQAADEMETDGMEPARPGYNIGKSGRKYTAAELEALIKE